MPPRKKKGRRKEAKPKDGAQEGETPFVAIDCVVCVYRVCTVCCSVKYVYGAVNPAVTV